MSWWGKYIGVPFVDGGRTIADGLDCWGLFRLVYAERLGVDLPTYGEISAKDLRAIAGAMVPSAERWKEVVVPRPLDGVLMRFYNRSWVGHCGVMVSGGRMLHTEPTISAAVVPLDHFSVRDRIAGFRRYVG